MDLGERSRELHRRTHQPSTACPVMSTQGFNHGLGAPMVTPWTWQNTNPMTVTQRYHPVLDTNHCDERQPLYQGWSYTPTIPGVNVVYPNGDMNRNSSSGGHQFADAVLRGPKLELPLFSGEEPIGWLEQREKFFEMVGTPREQWVNIATGHFAGKANTWFKGIGVAWQVLNWQQLCSMLLDRFAEASAHEAVERLQTMKHVGNVSKYIDYFEKNVELVRRDHPYLQEAFMLSCFIGGLKKEIKYGISMHQPRGLLEAYWFAKLEEKVVQAKRTSYLGGFNRNKVSTPSVRTGSVKEMNIDGNEKGKTQMQEGNKRTCWHCNEPWVLGHNLKCKVKKALHVILMQGEEEEAKRTEDLKLTKEPGFVTALGSSEETKEVPENEQLLVISSNAMRGISGPATFSLKTVLGGKQEMMLVDSGSTNSFMDYEFAIKSDCKLVYQLSKKVTVAGGGELCTDARTEKVSYRVQGCTFATSFQLLNLGSYDVILGADWIYEHSPIGMNLKTRELSIYKDGRTEIFKDNTIPDKHHIVGDT